MEYYLFLIYMNSSTSSDELDKIQSILDKLELIVSNRGDELSPEDYTFLGEPSNTEEIQAMKNIINNEVIPIITANKLVQLKQLKDQLSKRQNQSGGKRKRTQSKKSKKNKKRKSYKKRQT